MALQIPNQPPAKQLRIYQAIIKWTKKDKEENKLNYRQEYVIVAETPQEARMIAESHIHPLLFSKKEYTINITIKDFGIPQNVTTFYTSPILPDTYKPVIPGNTENTPVDPATDKNYISESEKDIRKLKEALQQEQENTKKAQEQQQMEEAKWTALLKEKDGIIAEKEKELTDKNIEITNRLAENNREWENRTKENKKEQDKIKKTIDRLKRQNTDIIAVKHELTKENQTLKEKNKALTKQLKNKTGIKNENTEESWKNKHAEILAQYKELQYLHQSLENDVAKQKERETELIDIALKTGIISTLLLLGNNESDSDGLDEKILTEMQKDHSVPLNYFNLQEKEIKEGKTVTPIETYLETVMREKKENRNT